MQLPASEADYHRFLGTLTMLVATKLRLMTQLQAAEVRPWQGFSTDL